MHNLIHLRDSRKVNLDSKLHFIKVLMNNHASILKTNYIEKNILLVGSSNNVYGKLYN